MTRPRQALGGREHGGPRLSAEAEGTDRGGGRRAGVESRQNRDERKLSASALDGRARPILDGSRTDAEPAAYGAVPGRWIVCGCVYMRSVSRRRRCDFKSRWICLRWVVVAEGRNTLGSRPSGRHDDLGGNDVGLDEGSSSYCCVVLGSGEH